MDWSILILAAFYIALGFGVVSGIKSVKGKVGFFEAFFIILFWPVILIGLIVIRLIE